MHNSINVPSFNSKVEAVGQESCISHANSFMNKS